MITACACDIAQQVAKCEPWTSTGVMSWQLLGKNSLCGLQERCRDSGAARTAQGKHTMAPRCFQGSAATQSPGRGRKWCMCTACARTSVACAFIPPPFGRRRMRRASVIYGAVHPPSECVSDFWASHHQKTVLCFRFTGGDPVITTLACDQSN